jgi:hypothetical protein
MASPSTMPFELHRILQMAIDGRNDDVLEALTALDCSMSEPCACLLIGFAQVGAHQFIKPLVKSGANPSYRDDTGSTALTEAIVSCPHSAAELTMTTLLEAGADPNGIGLGGSPPLVLAISNRKPELLQALLRFNADPEVRTVDLDRGMSASDLAKQKRYSWALEYLQTQKR